jgi:hypothetical protein
MPTKAIRHGVARLDDPGPGQSRGDAASRVLSSNLCPLHDNQPARSWCMVLAVIVVLSLARAHAEAPPRFVRVLATMTQKAHTGNCCPGGQRSVQDQNVHRPDGRYHCVSLRERARAGFPRWLPDMTPIFAWECRNGVPHAARQIHGVDADRRDLRHRG